MIGLALRNVNESSRLVFVRSQNWNARPAPLARRSPPQYLRHLSEETVDSGDD